MYMGKITIYNVIALLRRITQFYVAHESNRDRTENIARVDYLRVVITIVLNAFDFVIFARGCSFVILR